MKTMRWKQGLTCLLMVSVVFCLQTQIDAQAVWHVTTIDDNDDGSCNAGHCSLREAINAANLNMGPDSIVFDIPGAGPYTITPLSPLPAILDSFLVIEGTHQPGNAPMAGLIRIDGSNLSGPAMHGLVIYVRHVKIFGLQIQNFPGDGIQIFGGFLDEPFIPDITIGAPDKGNVIIGNGGYGIEADIDSNFYFRANRIGTNLNFAPGLGNGYDGVYLRILSADNSFIGGMTSSAQSNYFCSNTFSGLHLFIQDGNIFNPDFALTGNIFGTGAAGNEQLGNQGFTFSGMQTGGGLRIDGLEGEVLIGGPGGNENIFAYNYNGIVIDGTPYKSISANQFYCNQNEGIVLLNGGNELMPPPYALCVSGNTLQGYTEPNSEVFVYDAGTATCPGGCQGYTFLGSVTSGADGSWSLGGINPSITFVATATNIRGSSSPFSFCLGADTVSVSASNNGPVCEGDLASLSAIPSRNLQGINYAWSGPGGFTSTSQNPANAAAPGDYQVRIYLGDCLKDSATTTLTLLRHGRDTITDFCLGDSWTINGTTYDQDNTQGTEILPGAAANGCDSIIVFDMQFNPSILGRVYVPQYACAGDMITLEFDMIPLDGPYQVIYMSDNGLLDTLDNVFDGHQLQMPIETTTIFEVVDINTDLTICEPIVGGEDTVFVSDIAVTPVLSDFNGFNVSCPYLSDGSIELTYTGALQQVNITWGDTSLGDALRTGLAPGIYSATISDISGCATEVNFDLTSPQPIQPDVEEISTSCFGATDGMLLINDVLHAQGMVTGNFDSIVFFDLDNFPFTLDDLEAGLHTLDLQDAAGCAYQYSITIPTGPMTPIEIGPDRRIARGDSLQLEINMDFTPATIQWEPADFLSCSNCPDPVATPPVTTDYSVTVVDDEGCISIDSMTIDVYIPQNVFIPNVFSPNGDGQNDIFYIHGNDSVEEGLQVIIADRWGNIVFERGAFQLGDPTFGWDGLWNGEALGPGVFTYAFKISFINGQERWLTGSVALVR